MGSSEEDVDILGEADVDLSALKASSASVAPATTSAVSAGAVSVGGRSGQGASLARDSASTGARRRRSTTESVKPLTDYEQALAQYVLLSCA
eukprot:TRINITY_DN6394_c0_g1_i1.p1 TRINITY_DN6394_c0_g1~~TRINITY_DN6394_c0_g1_i1.p1  ORF type:complete len:101 (+),score=9.77 TRINITY_DN6394_c0_g1_i1:28-303(+)